MAYGHDMISLCMLKICSNCIYKPLQLISWSCIENWKFTSKWKEEKRNEQILENYRPVSELPARDKVFECLFYNSLFDFFIENELNSSNQSGFKPDHSYEVRGMDVKSEVFSSKY